MKLWVFILVILLSGCSSEVDKLIPDSYTIGAVQDIATTIKETDIGDKRLRVTGVVPFNIKRDRVLPSLLAVLKKTIKEHPSSSFIFVALSPDVETSLFDSDHVVGVATYENKKIKLKCSIPSDEHMAKHNARIGTMEPGGIFGEDTKHPVLYDGPLLSVPDKTTFQNIKKIVLLVQNNSMRKYDIDDRYNLISQQLGLSVKEVKNRHLFFIKYYEMAGPGSGENFNP